MAGLEELKSTLRSLVVSSPTQVDVRALLRDYRVMMGEALPCARYGYRDPLLFLRERCGDCFLFQGLSSNPTLILVVPDQLKHIDAHVRSQKTSSSKKFSCNKQKRVSVSDAILKPKESVIAQSYKDRRAKQIDDQHSESPARAARAPARAEPAPAPAPAPGGSGAPPRDRHSTSNLEQDEKENVANQEDGNYSRINLENFLRKRLPLYNSSQQLDAAAVETSSCKDGVSRQTSDSGRHSASSGGSARRAQLDELAEELAQLVRAQPAGVLCTDIVQLYRARFGRELELARCGLTSVLALLRAARGVRLERAPAGDWRALPADAPPAPPCQPRAPAPPRAPPPRAPPPRAPVDAEDALPGVDFDPDVFPPDCVHFLQSVPALGAAAFAPRETCGVAVGEVYSPSHFWLIRLGDAFNIAMEDMMDEMNEYYGSGAGRSRVLALGARRPGHYCAALYDGHWHRALIVRVLDCDTVKVRHVDYGTVERAAGEALRPLLQRWAALPAQAVRARLAGVRPGAAARRWPPAAAAAFLRLVRDKHLVASVLATDPEEDVVEVVLVDTATATDVVIGDELVRLGHADARAASALGTSECYLFPRFEALESGATPSYAEIHAYLRDGIALECVDEYRRHVPAALPPLAPAPAPAPARPPPAPPLLTCVPLMRGPVSHSDKAIQHSPPPSPALVDFSPPHSPPASPTILTTSLVQSLSKINISSPEVSAPSTTISAPSPVISAPSPVISAPSPAASAPSPVVSAPSPAVSAPSPAVSVVSPAPPASSTAVASASVTHALSPAAAEFSPGAPVMSPAPGGFSAGSSAAAAWGAPGPAHMFPGAYRPPAPPVRAPCALVYPQPLPPHPACYPYPYPPPAPPPCRTGAGGGGEAQRFRTPDGGSVTLSLAECEIYRLLARVDAHAAHWYMVDALTRAVGTRLVSAGPAAAAGPAQLNPAAREFRLRYPHPPPAHRPPPPPPPERMRPPPGFEDRW